MPAHLAPRTDRHRLVGALSVATGVALLTVGALGYGSSSSNDPGPSGSSDGTEPTVLGEVITRPADPTTTGEVQAAVPATFPGETTTTAAGTSTSSSGGRPRATPTTGPAEIGSPTSITVPTTRGFPPTTKPTTTTAPTTTTESTTTTTEADPPPEP